MWALKGPVAPLADPGEQVWSQRPGPVSSEGGGGRVCRRAVCVPSFSWPGTAATWGGWGDQWGLSRVGWARCTACWGSAHTCGCTCPGCGGSRARPFCHTHRSAAGKSSYQLGRKKQTSRGLGWSLGPPATGWAWLLATLRSSSPAPSSATSPLPVEAHTQGHVPYFCQLRTGWGLAGQAQDTKKAKICPGFSFPLQAHSHGVNPLLSREDTSFTTSPLPLAGAITSLPLVRISLVTVNRQSTVQAGGY